MSYAFDDNFKILYESVDPNTILIGPPFFVSRTINPDALPDIAGLKAAGVPVDYWKLVAGRILEMTAAEKLARDAAALTPVRRARRTLALLQDLQTYLDSRYAPTVIAFLTAMLLNPLSSAARLTHIRLVTTWQTAVLGTYKTALGAINAAATLAALNAVTYDFTTNNASDPLVTLSSALAL